MAAVKLTDKIYSVGVQNPDLRVFDIVMATKYGTSYNSYVVKGEEVALIEASHADFEGEYEANIREAVDPSKIKYIILNHTEPDHSGALRDLLKLCPEATVLATAVALNYLKNIVNEPFKSRPVKDGEVLDLGGVTLTFAPSPLLHWPDSMFTYCPEEKTLFSCDVFGSHYSSESILDKDIKNVDGYKEVPGYHDPEAFGELQLKMNWAVGRDEWMTQYEEGPWVYKREGTYYLIYPAGGVPEYMAYSTAPSIHGPWTFRGRIMDEAENSFTIHGGNINFKGRDYMFYHNGILPNGGGFHRSTSIEEFSFNPDGSIPFIPFTREGVEPVATLNPYETVQAETMASSWGVKLDRLDGTRHYVTSIHNGDWIKLRNVDFGENEPVLLSLEILNFQNEGKIEFYLDEMSGRPIVSMDIINDNMMVKAPVTPGVTGVHDLYILFRGGDEELFDLDWWKFNYHLNMPIIQTKYTADPAPMVHNDTIFLYTSHDDDLADNFVMKDWLLYTSTDMVNWEDHGAVASLKNFEWFDGDNGAWAACVVERDGKFYMYCPIHGHGIGVLVSDSPYGPFHDPIGKPLIWQRGHWYDIDPSVFIDDDGQAYMYWGNPYVYYVKLNDDMISYSGGINHIDYRIEHYQEGPWFYKRDGHYYLAFASTCCPEGIGYAMSDSPTGPWKSMGHIMDRTWRTRGNHPGIIDYKGKSYIFGQNYDLMHLETFVHHERRSVSAAEMHYNPDGSIQKVPYWLDNFLEPIEAFDPYRRVEAETMAWGYGLKTRVDDGLGIIINNVDEGEYLMLRRVDFGAGASGFTASVSNAGEKAAYIEVRLDSEDGPLCGTLEIKPTKGFKTLSCKLREAAGEHDLYFVFRGEAGKDLFEWDWWQMK